MSIVGCGYKRALKQLEREQTHTHTQDDYRNPHACAPRVIMLLGGNIGLVLPVGIVVCRYANELELTASLFRAVSGPTKHSSFVRGNWWVECCFRG